MAKKQLKAVFHVILPRFDIFFAFLVKKRWFRYSFLHKVFVVIRINMKNNFIFIYCFYDSAKREKQHLVHSLLQITTWQSQMMCLCINMVEIFGLQRRKFSICICKFNIYDEKITECILNRKETILKCFLTILCIEMR